MHLRAFLDSFNDGRWKISLDRQAGCPERFIREQFPCGRNKNSAPPWPHLWISSCDDLHPVSSTSGVSSTSKRCPLGDAAQAIRALRSAAQACAGCRMSTPVECTLNATEGDVEYITRLRTIRTYHNYIDII